MCYSCYTQKWVIFPISSLKQNLHTCEAPYFIFFSLSVKEFRNKWAAFLVQTSFFWVLGAIMAPTCGCQLSHHILFLQKGRRTLLSPFPSMWLKATGNHRAVPSWIAVTRIPRELFLLERKSAAIAHLPVHVPGLCVGPGAGRRVPQYHPGSRGAWSTRSESIWHWQPPWNCYVGSDPICCTIWNSMEYLGAAWYDEGKSKWVFR